MQAMTTSIGHYRLLDVVGFGGMGVVCRAEDTTLKRSVALKFLAPAWASDEEYRARFLREARMAASLNHPNTCVVFEVGELGVPVKLPQRDEVVEPGTPFIAMEFVEGDTLAASLLRAGQLTEHAAIDIALQLAEGLAEAHSRGIIHRDLKPQNVMITPSGRVKIVDFGLARPIRAVRDPQRMVSTSEMISADLGDGAVVGTCAYMSPEQAAGKSLDARSDIFAFGTILYQMIAGQLPFRGDTATETLAKILETAPAPLPKDNPASQPFVDIIWKCLEKSADRRYGDARDVLRALRAVAATRESTAPNVSHRSARRRWAVAAMLLVGLGASYAIVRGIDRARPELATEASPAEGRPVHTEQPPAEPTIERNPSDTPAATPPKPPLQAPPSLGKSTRPSSPVGTLSVSSTPRSSVSLDGNLTGITPLTLETSAGTHEILLTADDGLRWRSRIEVAAGQVVSLHRDLNAAGSLSVVSDIWADVSLDDRAPEQTPIHFSRVATGLHSVRVSREGYVTQGLEVFIEEGKATSLRITLEKQP
jgi:serine/threonine protein kinase